MSSVLPSLLFLLLLSLVLMYILPSVSAQTKCVVDNDFDIDGSYYFFCPRDKDPEEFIACCGPRCCANTTTGFIKPVDDVIMAGTTIIVQVVLVIVLVACVVGCCSLLCCCCAPCCYCHKKKRAARAAGQGQGWAQPSEQHTTSA